jgi:hypothetical protein
VSANYLNSYTKQGKNKKKRTYFCVILENTNCTDISSFFTRRTEGLQIIRTTIQSKTIDLVTVVK